MKAVEHYLATLPQDSSSDDTPARCLMSESKIERSLNDGVRALAAAQRGVEIMQRNRSRTQWMNLTSSITLADAQRSAGHFAQADNSYQHISDGLDRLNMERTSVAANLYNNWEVGLMSLGQPARAAGLFQRVMDYDKGLPTPDSMARLNYAVTLVQLGRPDDARRLLELAYADAVANGNRNSTNMVRMALAGTYRELGQLVRSNQLLRDTESELRTMLSQGHEAFGALHLQRALLAQKRQDSATALHEADAALTIFSAKPGLALRAATTRYTRAEILLELGRVDEARAEISQSMLALQNIIGPGVNSLHVGRAWLVTAQIEAKARNTVAAQSAADQAYAQLEATIGAQHPLTIAAHNLADNR